MASQQAIFAQTIAAIKRNLKRKAYESDSDDSINHNGNRGQKLKKRARFTRQGQLAPPTGPEEIEYAGTRRSIISRNPALIDDDGFEVDSEDDDERLQDALANAADMNPYANVHLEQILAPLTAVTDLADHPALATAFKSKNLTQLATQASELMRKEQRALWKVKRLMTGFCGDYTWIPCGVLVGPNDIELYRDDNAYQDLVRQRLAITGLSDGSSGVAVNAEQKPTVNGASSAADTSPAKDAREKAAAGDDVTMADAEVAQQADKNVSSNKEEPEKDSNPDRSEGAEGEAAGKSSTTDPKPAAGSTEKPAKPEESTKSNSSAGTEPASGKAVDNENVEMKDANPTTSNEEPRDSHENNEVGQPAAKAYTDSDDFPIHPLFTPPTYPRPDRDMGLPENEAENVRHLLSLYIQKQEEVSRGAVKLYLNLLKADRLRQQVLRWSKAEGHVGELSDGEDWYDWEEWNLTEDLKKGQDEEEEELPVGKKTRTRRN